MNEVRIFDAAGRLKKTISSKQATGLYWKQLTIDDEGITQQAKRKRSFNPHLHITKGGICRKRQGKNRF